MMRQRPVHTEDLMPAASMVRPHSGAMTLDQRLGVPCRLKDGFVHRATARCITIPHLEIVDALQRLIRTEDEARDIPTDVLKAFRATKEVAKRGHPSGDRLRYPGNRHHVILPPVSPYAGPRLGASLQRSHLTALSSSLPLFLAITFQVVFEDAIGQAFLLLKERQDLG